MVLIEGNEHEEYSVLADNLPLEVPYTLMIDPGNACNFQCTFCPTGDKDLLKSVNRPLGMMKLDLFRKIIDDMAGFKQKVRSLRLYKDGEPFLNKDISEMVSYAKKKAVSQEAYIISNGSLITKEAALKLLHAGLDRLRISVEHVNDEDYKKITKTFGDYKKIVENVRYLYQEKVKMGHHLHINSKIVDTGLSEHDFKKFKNDFGPISDSLTVESLMGWSKSFVKDFTIGKEISYGIDYQSKLNSIEVCPQPFKGLAVNFDGTVSICCVDWSHGTLVGDTKKESIVDIWFGQKLREFRLMHLRKERNKISACADCHYIKGHKPEAYLDHKTEELIKIYEN